MISKQKYKSNSKTSNWYGKKLVLLFTF